MASYAANEIYARRDYARQLREKTKDAEEMFREREFDLSMYGYDADGEWVDLAPQHTRKVLREIHKAESLGDFSHLISIMPFERDIVTTSIRHRYLGLAGDLIGLGKSEFLANHAIKYARFLRAIFCDPRNPNVISPQRMALLDTKESQFNQYEIQVAIATLEQYDTFTESDTPPYTSFNPLPQPFLPHPNVPHQLAMSQMQYAMMAPWHQPM